MTDKNTLNKNISCEGKLNKSVKSMFLKVYSNIKGLKGVEI